MRKNVSVIGVLFNYALNCLFYTETPGCILIRSKQLFIVFYIYCLQNFSKFEILWSTAQLILPLRCLRYIILNVSVLLNSTCAFSYPYSWHSFPPIFSISRNDTTIHQSTQLRNLGIIFNFSFSLIFHIQSIITSYVFYFQNIILILHWYQQALIIYCLVYCKSLLTDLPTSTLADSFSILINIVLSSQTDFRMYIKFDHAGNLWIGKTYL